MTNAQIARAIVSPVEDTHVYGLPELDGPIIAALDAKDAELRTALGKAAQMAMDAAPKDGKQDATAFVQLAFDIQALAADLKAIRA